MLEKDAAAEFENPIFRIVFKIWNRAGQLQRSFCGHNNCINGVSFSPDGKTFATASNHADATVKLWNLEGQELKTLKGHGNTVLAVSFSPDGTVLASASDGWHCQAVECRNSRL